MIAVRRRRRRRRMCVSFARVLCSAAAAAVAAAAVALESCVDLLERRSNGVVCLFTHVRLLKGAIF